MTDERAKKISDELRLIDVILKSSGSRTRFDKEMKLSLDEKNLIFVLDKSDEEIKKITQNKPKFMNAPCEPGQFAKILDIFQKNKPIEALNQ